MGCTSSRNLPPVEEEFNFTSVKLSSENAFEMPAGTLTPQLQILRENDPRWSEFSLSRPLVDEEVIQAVLNVTTSNIEQDDFTLREDELVCKRLVTTPPQLQILRENDPPVDEEVIHLEEAVLNSNIEQDDFTLREEELKDIALIEPRNTTERQELTVEDISPPEQSVPTQSELEMPMVFTQSEEFVLAKTRSGRVGSIVVSHHGTDGINGRLLFKSGSDKPEMRTTTSMTRISVITS